MYVRVDSAIIHLFIQFKNKYVGVSWQFKHYLKLTMEHEMNSLF